MKVNNFCVIKNEPFNWRDVAPKTKHERLETIEEYGDYCFIDPEELKFPICDKNNGCISCKGLRSAMIRAKQLYTKTDNSHYKDIYDKIYIL